MFYDNGTKLIHNTGELEDHIGRLPIAHREPLSVGESPRRIASHEAITVNGNYVGDCSVGYELLQFASSFDPLIPALKNHEFTAKPWNAADGSIQGLIIRLEDVSTTLYGGKIHATIRVRNSILPGTSLGFDYGIWKVLCSNGMKIGAAKTIQIQHSKKMREKLPEFERAIEFAPNTLKLYAQMMESLPRFEMTVEQVTGWLVGAGFGVADVVSAVHETQSHLFGEQQDIYAAQRWTPQTLLDVATHIVSNPRPKKDGSERNISTGTQWARLTKIDQSIGRRDVIVRTVDAGLKKIREADVDSAMREQLLPLIRA